MKDEAAAGTTPTVSWLRGFDGIRGVAALMIVLAHTITFLKADGYAAPGLLGKVYVVCTQSLTMFFLLSGFLLYRPFVKSIVQRRPLPNVRDYYRGRVLRIYPANIVIVLVAGLLLGVTVTRLLPFGDGRLVDIGRLTDPGTLVANLLLVQGYFPHTVLTGLDASWSLVVEAMFYLVLPPLAWLGLRLSRRLPALAAAAVPAGVLIVIGSVCRQIGYAMLNDNGANYGPTWTTVFQRSFLANCDLIGWGMLVAAVTTMLTLHPERDRLLRRANRLSWAGIVIGLLLVAAIQTDPYIAPFAGLACAGFLFRIALPQGRRLWERLVTVLEMRPIRFVGEVSYSLYLWHFVVIMWVRNHLEAARYESVPSLVLAWALAAGASVALGAVTFHLVEAPAMRRAKHLAQRRRASQERAAEADLAAAVVPQAAP